MTCPRNIVTDKRRVGGEDGWGRGAWWGENGDTCT